MPYTIRKVSRRNCYTVRKMDKRKKHRVLSKCTSLTKAKKQIRLLYAVDNPNFVLRKKSGTRSRKNK